MISRSKMMNCCDLILVKQNIEVVAFNYLNKDMMFKMIDIKAQIKHEIHREQILFLKIMNQSKTFIKN
jgi:hypothetical protein